MKVDKKELKMKEFKLGGYIVKGPTYEQIEDDDFDRRCQEKYNYLTKIRSFVIEKAVAIERLLTTLLLHFLVGINYNQHHLLRDFIFDAEFCTFMHKWRMLRKVFAIYPKIDECISKEEGKLLRKDLKEIISKRNMFAHGDIFIDAETENIIIEYYEDGRKELVISEDVVEEICNTCALVREKLFELNDYFRDKHKCVS